MPTQLNESFAESIDNLVESVSLSIPKIRNYQIFRETIFPIPFSLSGLADSLNNWADSVIAQPSTIQYLFTDSINNWADAITLIAGTIVLTLSDSESSNWADSISMILGPTMIRDYQIFREVIIPARSQQPHVTIMT